MSKKIKSENEKLTYVFDMDGVVYRGDRPQEHAVSSINKLVELGHNVYYFTNNASATRKSYTDKLGSMGIFTTEDKIMTSSYAAALYIKEHYDTEGKTAYIVGHEGIFDELERIGITPFAGEERKEADFVVAGIDRGINYNKIWAAMYAINKGAIFIATNKDKTYPLEDKLYAPGGGVMVEAIETCTGVVPYVCGKPNTYALDKIIEETGVKKDNLVLVGDRLDTDIELANRARVNSVLVMGGCTTLAEAKAATGICKPDFIIKNLSELLW